MHEGMNPDLLEYDQFRCTYNVTPLLKEKLKDSFHNKQML